MRVESRFQLYVDVKRRIMNKPCNYPHAERNSIVPKDQMVRALLTDLVESLSEHDSAAAMNERPSERCLAQTKYLIIRAGLMIKALTSDSERAPNHGEGIVLHDGLGSFKVNLRGES